MRKFVSGTLIILLANLTMGLIGNADDNINVTDKNLFNTETKIDDEDLKIAFLVFIFL